MQCVHCGRSTDLPEAGARAIGWRVFNGTLISGALYRDVLCPNCSGRQCAAPPSVHMDQDSLLDLLLDKENP